ncbi:hypothetical protein [Dyadobacter aurulentus]|uniref:hypothetical protein n=1 Tax=Dyadobacter sp. UC 10 TaxID=2605428 RepID=UPI0011F28F1C|nr:hypothetical protein [Dyadobacter sp. UC 10]KAA0989610.1 hypothetical protein FXO21_05240 [Dyadobacter sp. UC 10]
MKRILTILLACTSTFSLAQKKSTLSRSIDDDGKKMSIRVTGTIDGREINFNRSFDVAGMSKDERKELRDEVLESIDSGGLDIPEPPVRMSIPAPPIPPQVLEPEAYVSVGKSPGIFQSGDSHGKTFQGLDSAGYRKHVKYNPHTGEMFLQYHFRKNNEEFVYEKTVNAADKSETERQSVIERFEQEIELPGKGVGM